MCRRRGLPQKFLYRSALIENKESEKKRSKKKKKFKFHTQEILHFFNFFFFFFGVFNSFLLSIARRCAYIPKHQEEHNSLSVASFSSN